MANGKYQPWLETDGLLRLSAWARDGLTDEMIAKKMGIATSTLYAWKKNHKEISEALKRGKEIVDIEVENALLRRAKGYSYNEVTVESVGKAVTKTKTVTKQVPPDTTAMIWWLKNRKPDLWRDKPEPQVDDDADKGGMIEIAAMMTPTLPPEEAQDG